MSLTVLIIIIVICLLLEGFFSGSEIALVVSDKVRLKNRADTGDRDAKATQKLISSPRRFFSTTILGTNICVVTATTVLTYYIISNYGDEYSAFALLLSPLILVFGEVLPKSIYQHHADFLAKKVGVVLSYVSIVLYPFVWALSNFTKLLLGRVEKAASVEPRISRDELMLMLSSKEVKNSDMPPQERQMIKKVLDLSDSEVKNIMVPLVEVEMLPIGSDLDAALSIFDLKGLSRLLIFEHRAYNVIGILDMADCFFATKTKIMGEMIKPVIYVPENMPLYELYETMRGSHQDVVVVVDEFGGATGLVTLEDLLEEVVGEIKDEYELGKEHYSSLGHGRFLVSGRMEIEEANEKLRLNIPDGDYETVAGYLLELFGYIPGVGEHVSEGEWVYTILKATPRAILEIEAKKRV